MEPLVVFGLGERNRTSLCPRRATASHSLAVPAHLFAAGKQPKGCFSLRHPPLEPHGFKIQSVRIALLR